MDTVKIPIEIDIGISFARQSIKLYMHKNVVMDVQGVQQLTTKKSLIFPGFPFLKSN